MRVKIDGAVLYLGRLREDGFRNVERLRLTNFRTLLPPHARCTISTRCSGPLTKHHIRRRRFSETR